MKLSEETLAVFSPAQRRQHDRFYALRNKHAAHAVNAFEESEPVARFCVERLETVGITAIEVNHARISGLSAPDAMALAELCDVLIQAVKARFDTEKARILQYVRGFPAREFVEARSARVACLNDEPHVNRVRHPKPKS